MSQQIINDGSAVNDHTGDPLRTGWIKTNANFTELYTTYAPLVSPVFTGDPKAPTPAPGDNDTSIATTAFVTVSFAPLASPTFTGDPKSVTPATGDNDTSIATTAFVKAQAYATLASPALTGAPTAPTAAPGANNTQLATTGFVAASFAPLASPFLTGTVSIGTVAAHWDTSSPGGGNINMAATGTDATIGALFTGKGNSTLNFYSNNFASLHLLVGGSTTANNAYVQVLGSFNAPSIIQPGGAGSARLSILAADLSTNPTAPTQSTSDNSTRIATTAFVQAVHGTASTKDAFCATRGGVDQGGFPSATFAQAAFTTEVFDQNNKFNTGLARWIPSAGLVMVCAQAYMSSLDVGAGFQVAVYKNGAALRIGSYGPYFDAGTAATAAVTALDLANGTDFYECWINCPGAAGGTLSGITSLSFFQGVML